MNTFNDFAKKTKFSMAAIHTPHENHEELKERIDELYGLKIDEFSGTSVLDIGIGLMQETYKMETPSELNPIIDAINSLKVNVALYSIVRSFVFDFAKFGPEIYEKLEQGNITPEKQWQINLKKIENDFLYGKGTDEQVKRTMVKVLSETKTPIALGCLSAFISQVNLNNLKNHLLQNKTEYLNKLTENAHLSPDESLRKYFNYIDSLLFNTNFDNKTDVITIIPSKELLLHINPVLKSIYQINIKQIELSKLANTTEQSMQNYLNSGKIEDSLTLSKGKITLLLKSFIKIARKYQGIQKIRERERNLLDNAPLNSVLKNNSIANEVLSGTQSSQQQVTKIQIERPESSNYRNQDDEICL